MRWMYSTILNGGTPEEIADVLTEMAIPTGGRRKKDGTLNTHWSGNGVIATLRNEKHCGDVLARKTYTPNYKDHKAKKNRGKKNKYFQPDHHEAIVSRSMWNAAQRILNSRRYGHEGTYMPMRIIDKGALTGYISMNRSWAGFDYEDYYRASQIAMGLLDDNLEVDIENEYLPENGRRIGGLVDDHGIAQIARDLTAAEKEIKDELEGRTQESEDAKEKAEAVKSFQVVCGEMFSHNCDPVIRFSPKRIRFSSTCVSKLPGVEYAEILFNPVERMLVIRPCRADYPNAVKWDTNDKGSAPMNKVIYDSMGWESDYNFRVPCQVITQPNEDSVRHSVQFFDLDNFIGQDSGKNDEVIIQKNSEEFTERPSEEAKSFFYPPDEEEPQEIKDMEDRLKQAVEMNRKIFGIPVFQYSGGIRELCFEDWDVMAEARPLDITHTVDIEAVDSLLLQIKEAPPPLPQTDSNVVEKTIEIDPEEQEE